MTTIATTFSIQQDDTFTPIHQTSIDVQDLQCPAVEIHTHLDGHLRRTGAPAGVYGFTASGELRWDRWDGNNWHSCYCRAGVDPDCGQYACWGNPA